MSENKSEEKKKFNWSGFTLQSFFVTVLPLTILLLVVAFGSQSLHNRAMRNLVGDRDLRTVQVASNSLEAEINHLLDTLKIFSLTQSDQPTFSSQILEPEEISTIFDGGLAIFSSKGELIQSTSVLVDWQNLPLTIPDTFSLTLQNNHQPVLSSMVSSQTSTPLMIAALSTKNEEVVIGAFSPNHLIRNSISELIDSEGTTIIVVMSPVNNDPYDMIFTSENKSIDNINLDPVIFKVLDGDSGLNYYQDELGEHVIAYAPISSVGWGLIIEELWEDIADPYLITTQSAPLVFVPAFLLAIIAIWFGVNRIVKPLQKLEKQASSLALGNFEEIHHSVGGIEEIRNLQSELIETADMLKEAQQSLHGYIGAITTGIENERRNLAREMHDESIQSLIALNHQIQLMKSSDLQKDGLHELQAMVKQIISDLRRMIRGLRPIYLEDLGLVTSLEMLVREIEQSSNISINFQSIGRENRYNPQIEMSLYRMVQESLNNVVHHSNAEHAWVEIVFEDSYFSAQIRDDGKGFVVPKNSAEFPQKGHFGLLGLKERAELINAEMEIISKINEGTTVSIRFSNTIN